MKTTVAIVGGGPGGTTCAMHLARAGIDAVVIEQESMPRYQIGESLTFMAGRQLRRLGLETIMERNRFPVKHNVVVYGPASKNSFTVPVMDRSETGELVPATTWQVRRSIFDHELLEAAKQRGATHIHGKARRPLLEAGKVRGVEVETPGGESLRIEADHVVDASGKATFLHQAGVAGPQRRGAYDNQVATFSQVKGAVRDPGDGRGNTLIFYREKHHWAWFIPIDDETVSLGVVTPASYFKARKEDKNAFLLRELRELAPELQRRVAGLDLAE
ncbi:MAG: tryptophan 7-halogenase, partial [Verrucomicrobiota bacterium]